MAANTNVGGVEGLIEGGVDGNGFVVRNNNVNNSIVTDGIAQNTADMNGTMGNINENNNISDVVDGLLALGGVAQRFVELEQEPLVENSLTEEDNNGEGLVVEEPIAQPINNTETFLEFKESGRPPLGTFMEDLLSAYDERQQDTFARANSTDEHKARRQASILETATDIEAEMKESMELSPQSQPHEFLCQLEMLERLYQKYKSSNLKKTILAYYLKATEMYRLDLLHWMGSGMTHGHQPSYGEGPPPNVPLRLNQIPLGWEMLADKGFVGTERSYPNGNKQRTPFIMRGRIVRQYTTDEILGKAGKRLVCRLRYTSEWCFAQVTILNALRDIIPYQNIGLLPYFYEWGHAMINLAHHPHCMPGPNSGINAVEFFDLPRKQNKNAKRFRTRQ